MNTWYHQAVQFVKEAIAELKKVTWLSRKEVIASTVVLIILVCIVGIFVSCIDFVLALVLGRIL